MNSRIVFFAISFCLRVTIASCQNASSSLLHATDFFGDPVSVHLKSKDSAVAVVFLSASKCTRCVEELGKELNALGDAHVRVRILVLVRVGPAPMMRKQCIDMLELNPGAKRRVHFLYDVSNAVAGTEKDEEIQGNFGTYAIKYTPAMLVSTRKGKLRLYKYDDLFDSDGRAVVKLGEIIRGLER